MPYQRIPVPERPKSGPFKTFWQPSALPPWLRDDPQPEPARDPLADFDPEFRAQWALPKKKPSTKARTEDSYNHKFLELMLTGETRFNSGVHRPAYLKAIQERMDLNNVRGELKVTHLIHRTYVIQLHPIVQPSTRHSVPAIAVCERPQAIPLKKPCSQPTVEASAKHRARQPLREHATPARQARLPATEMLMPAPVYSSLALAMEDIPPVQSLPRTAPLARHSEIATRL